MTKANPVHVLVINDTPSILEVFRLLFEDEGFKVSLDSFAARETGAKLAMVKKLAPDVIVLDFLIGGEPLGWQLLQVLRMDRETAVIPIVVCTAAVKQVEELGSHLTAMGIEVVIKPFDIDDVLAAVTRALAARDRLSERIDV